MAFRFRLFLDDGSDLREFESAVSNWRPGDVIPGGRNQSYRVVRVLGRDSEYGGAPFDETSPYVAFLVVEPS
jgi:hypothetical protein